MTIHPLVLQFGGSLIAILVLFLIARALRLGGNPVLNDADDVLKSAHEVEDGFQPHRISISRKGDAALASNPAGQIMVLKRHGNRFAGRVLDRKASVREEVDALIVETGEARFGAVRLAIDDPGYWADAINRL